MAFLSFVSFCMTYYNHVTACWLRHGSSVSLWFPRLCANVYLESIRDTANYPGFLASTVMVPTLTVMKESTYDGEDIVVQV